MFNNQKNGTKGNTIGHGITGHPVNKPVRITTQLIHVLRSKGANSDIDLAAIRSSTTTWRTVTSD